MPLASYPCIPLSRFAKQGATPIGDIDIHVLIHQRKYLFLKLAGSQKPIYLTARQLQCLILVIKGYSDALAAETLRISRHTFYEHMRLVSNKLATRKRDKLIEHALSAKIWL